MKKIAILNQNNKNVYTIWRAYKHIPCVLMHGYEYE